MTQHRLAIVRTLVAAYGAWWRLLAAMWPMILSAFIVILAISIVASYVPRHWEEHLAGEAFGLVQSAVWAFLLAPIVIAIHRFVILDEITPTYTFGIGKPAFRMFFGWLFALEVLAGLPLDLLGFLEALNWSLLATILSVLAVLVIVAGVSLRLTILLPAIAVEAPGATPSRAIADSKGQALRLLALFLLAILPWLALEFFGILLLGRRVQIPGAPPAIIFLVVGCVMKTIILSIAAVIASYAFMILAAQVKRAD